MAPPPVLTKLDAKLIRRGRWYPQLWVHGSGLPPVPTPLTVLRATHVDTGATADFTNYLVYGPTLLYVWGTVPRHIPKGYYNLAYVTNDVAISTITKAFLIKG